ncbi:unnamed protein product [Paramecium primaurelia]|uniref:Cyclin-dependent kinase 2 homolog n=1 Tax=Paramecium primaurelia TaxID=5886 RepID=A0A8S1MJY3_PARPR|nr:unnamed protein product [Paramecium primaurelia]
MLGNLGVQICRTTTSQLPAQDLNQTYIIQKHVGQGKYGQVFKAQNKLNKQIVALKKIKQEKEANGFPRTAMREIHLLSSIKHENIVSFQEVVVQSSKEKAVIMYREHLFGLGIHGHRLAQSFVEANSIQFRLSSMFDVLNT